MYITEWLSAKPLKKSGLRTQQCGYESSTGQCSAKAAFQSPEDGVKMSETVVVKNAFLYLLRR